MKWPSDHILKTKKEKNFKIILQEEKKVRNFSENLNRVSSLKRSGKLCKTILLMSQKLTRMIIVIQFYILSGDVSRLANYISTRSHNNLMKNRNKKVFILLPCSSI